MSKRLLAAVCLLHMSLCAYAEQSAQLVTALINGCGPSEGASEYLIIYSGGSSFTANSTNINVQYSSTDIASLVTVTDSFVAGGNSTYVSNLNTQLVGCDFSFINVIPGSTSIAAGSHILVLNDDVLDTIDFSAFCGQNLGNIYVLFSDDTSWPSTGRFANSPGSDRLFRSTINGTQTDFSYSDNWATDSDGDYVTWNDGGGAGAIYSNYPSCAPDNVNALPVTLLSFTCRQNGNHVEVVWETASEENNSHFTIFRSSNGREWNEIRMISGKGTTNGLSFYSISDTPPYSGRWYYRLKQTDYNGEFEFFEIISVWFKTNETEMKVFPNPASNVFNVMSATLIEEAWVISSYGNMTSRKPVTRVDQVSTFSIADLSTGVYHLIILDKAGQRQKFKFVVGN
ncbi:hypothetical protein [uncultured Roseivirga sp.]|uniref:hypothetical protein n=1 Tax=uncultured Roseivirga sp. TaxID=543088 RepID=UPI0030D9CE0A|tara:strand:+ start:152160 stop:153356 length:1197 start_codon:yes stop_codon:yes gene_type:complete